MMSERDSSARNEKQRDPERESAATCGELAAIAARTRARDSECSASGLYRRASANGKFGAGLNRYVDF